MAMEGTTAVAVKGGGGGVGSGGMKMPPCVPLPEGMAIEEGESQEVFADVRRVGNLLYIDSVDGHSLTPEGRSEEGEAAAGEGAEVPGQGGGPGMAEAFDDYAAGLRGGGGMG